MIVVLRQAVAELVILERVVLVLLFVIGGVAALFIFSVCGSHDSALALEEVLNVVHQGVPDALLFNVLLVAVSVQVV